MPTIIRMIDQPSRGSVDMMPKTRFKESHRSYEIGEIMSNSTVPPRKVIPREQLEEYQSVSEWIESISENSPYLTSDKPPF